MCDERKTPSSCDGESWWGSNYGDEIDIIAPGVKIYTTDISGTEGYDSGNYKSDFNGTSSACPNAAGVAALILSANPSLTKHEVREILEKSTNKVPSYSYSTSSSHPNGTWNNEVGYGRLNAANAVREAIFSYVSIEGNNIVCTSGSTYNVDNLPPNTTVSWSSSSNITFPSGSTGSSVSAQASSSTTSGSGWLEATLTTSNGSVTLPRKDVWVGVPSPENINFINIGPNYPSSMVLCNDVPNDGIVNWNGLGSVSEYSWSVYGCNNDWQVIQHPMDPFSDVPMENVQFSKPYGSTCDRVSVIVKARNQCGWGQYKLPALQFSTNPCNGGWYMQTSPNPANAYAEISFYNKNEISEYQKSSPTMLSVPLNEQTQELGEYEIQIWHERKGLVRKIKSRDKKLQIKTNNLDEGLYFLHVIINGQVYKQKLKVER